MKSIFFRCFCSALLASMATVSCSANDRMAEETSVNGDANIVAGHNEPSFTENFGLELALPIDESEFRALLESRKIQYRLIDASKENEVLPLPRHRKGIDPSVFRKMYEIYGGVDADSRIGKRFRAYIDANGKVVYVENAFSYTGP